MRKFIAALFLMILAHSAFAQLPNAPTWMPGGGVQTCNETWPGTTPLAAGWQAFPGGTAAPLYNTNVLTAVLPQNLVPANPGLDIITKKQNFQLTSTSWTNYTGSYINGNRMPVDACGPQQYGWFQSTFTEPSQQSGALGSWTAFWLLPWDNRNEWELDVMERFSGAFGGQTGPTLLNSTLHWNHYCAGCSAVICSLNKPDNWEGSHTFAVDWQPTYISIYIDGTLCTEPTNNPTGQYTGVGLAFFNTPGYTLWDNYITSASENQQGDLLMPNKMHVVNSLNWQKTGNPPTDAVAPVVFKQMTLAFDKTIYYPGDTVHMTSTVTAGPAGAQQVAITGGVFDYCGDAPGNSYCMYPANNNTFGLAINSTLPLVGNNPKVNLGPGQSVTWTYLWVVPGPTPPNTTPTTAPGIYTVEVKAQDTTGGLDNLPVQAYIQIGNPVSGQ